MKSRKFGQAVLAVAVSLIAALSTSSCTTGTIDFLYVTTSRNTPGQVAVFKVDRQSGTLTPASPAVYNAGKNPVAGVVSPNDRYLYVVNHDDSTVMEFTIASGSGNLTLKNTYNTPGTCPISAAINAAGTFLYVVDTFQPGANAPNCVLAASSAPVAGDVAVYPVSATDGSLGTPVANPSVSPAVPYFPVGNTPTAVAVPLSGASVYVVNKADATISAFNTSSSGALAAVATVPAGTAPNAIAIDPTSRFVYVTDSLANQLIAYAIQPSGTLHTVNNNGPFAAGNFPAGVTVDPRGYYLYLTNFNDRSVAAYAIDLSSGAPSRVASTSTVETGTGPTCVIVDPSLGRYVYTSNFLDNTLSGFRLDVHSGALSPIQDTPYNIPGGAAKPTCVIAITHGNHALQNNQP